MGIRPSIRGLRPYKRRWVDRLLVGHLVLFRSGVVRTVIEASYREDGRLFGAVFPILRCSWTKRGFTHMDRWQLLAGGVRIVGTTKAPISAYPIARKLLADLREHPREPEIGCCDVVGVFE